MDLIFTKTVTVPANTSARKVIKSMNEQGYTLTGAEDEKRGEYLGNCEDCGCPVFSLDGHFHDDEGVYWHQECQEGGNNGKS